jgi:hypothetical protein
LPRATDSGRILVASRTVENLFGLSLGCGIVEHVFEGVVDGELIEVMGEACRDESTAIAQRLAAVAELYVRRKGPLADTQWWVADDCDAVAAEVGAAQHISHARAVAQVQFACNLWHRLPTVARIFLRGTLDYRVVSAIVNRTDNVADDLMPELDAKIAEYCQKWRKLSGPKLRDRIDQWVAKFDPAAVRVPPRSPTTAMSVSRRAPPPGPRCSPE